MKQKRESVKISTQSAESIKRLFPEIFFNRAIEILILDYKKNNQLTITKQEKIELIKHKFFNRYDSLINRVERSLVKQILDLNITAEETFNDIQKYIPEFRKEMSAPIWAKFDNLTLENIRQIKKMVKYMKSHNPKYHFLEKQLTTIESLNLLTTEYNYLMRGETNEYRPPKLNKQP